MAYEPRLLRHMNRFHWGWGGLQYIEIKSVSDEWRVDIPQSSANLEEGKTRGCVSNRRHLPEACELNWRPLSGFWGCDFIDLSLPTYMKKKRPPTVSSNGYKWSSTKDVEYEPSIQWRYLWTTHRLSSGCAILHVCCSVQNILKGLLWSTFSLSTFSMLRSAQGVFNNTQTDSMFPHSATPL